MPLRFRSLFVPYSIFVASCGGAYDRAGDSTAGRDGNGRACEYDGTFYGDGDSFPANDGCNDCSCDDGSVLCTQIACNSCEDIQDRWSAALADAKRCSPSDSNACSRVVSSGLTCRCDTFVDPARAEGIAAMAAAQDEFQAASCAGPVACGPCLPPTSAVCSSDNTCVDR
jgi:hypothetical protein